MSKNAKKSAICAKIQAMSLEKMLDEQIEKAIAEGKFDNLEGAGKPLDLDDYFAAPEDIRAGYTLLKNNDFVPEEVELLKEIGILREKTKNCADENEKKILGKKLNERNLALTMILERNRRKTGR
jgi:Domain of unknown function (DUF1992)